MSNSMLFNYSVEEKDGAVVITLAGKLAVPIMQDIAANMGAEAAKPNGVPKMFPYSLLASHAVRMSAQDNTGQDDAGETDLAAIFAQGFDKDLEAFDRQLERYRTLLSPVELIGRSPEMPFSTSNGEDALKAKRPAAKN